MDLDLTDAQRLAAETVRAFADKEVAARAAEIDRTDEFPRDLYRRLADLGLLGMTLPATYGGAGVDTLTWTLCQEELARGSAAVAHGQLLCTILSELLLVHGSEAQRRRWLPAMARGEAICAIAIAKTAETPLPTIQPMPAPAPPTDDVAWAKELMPPDRMQIIENEMAKFENPPIVRNSSCA